MQICISLQAVGRVIFIVTIDKTSFLLQSEILNNTNCLTEQNIKDLIKRNWYMQVLKCSCLKVGFPLDFNCSTVQSYQFYLVLNIIFS